MTGLAAALLLLCGTVASQCPCEFRCDLRDDDVTSGCFDLDATFNLTDVFPENLTTHLYFPNAIRTSNDKWGVFVPPLIDLSQQSEDLLRNGGLSEEALDTVRPFLGPEVVGGAAFLRYWQTPDRNLSLSQPAQLQRLQEVVTDNKVKNVEAIYNNVANRLPMPNMTCFLGLTKVQRSVLVAVSWLVRWPAQLDAFHNAAAGNWDLVLDEFHAKGHELYSNPDSLDEYFYNDDGFIGCPSSASRFMQSVHRILSTVLILHALRILTADG